MTSSQSKRGGSSPRSVTAQRTYRVSPETAFGAWINPTALAKWFGPPGFRAEILTHDLQVGGRWRFLMQGDDGEGFHHFGRFVEIAPPYKLAFTWASEEQIEGWRDEHGDPTLVTVEFTPCPAGTQVTVTHEKLTSEFARHALTGGWSGGLECLSEFLEGSSSTTASRSGDQA